MREGQGSAQPGAWPDRQDPCPHLSCPVPSVPRGGSRSPRRAFCQILELMSASGSHRPESGPTSLPELTAGGKLCSELCSILLRAFGPGTPPFCSLGIFKPSSLPGNPLSPFRTQNAHQLLREAHRDPARCLLLVLTSLHTRPPP